MNPTTGIVYTLAEVLGRAIRTPEDEQEARHQAEDQGLALVSEEVAAATTVGLQPPNRASRRREQQRLRRESRRAGRRRPAGRGLRP